MPRPPRTAGALLGLVMALSACGSTVATTGTSAGAPAAVADGLAAPGVQGPAGADGLGDPQLTGPSTTGGVAGPSGGSLGGGTGSAAGPAAAGSSSGSAPGAGRDSSAAVPPGRGGTVAARTGPGVTATTIRMGALYLSPGEQDRLNNSAGVGGSDDGSGEANARQEFRALVDHVNARGGLGGRKVELFPREVEVTNGADFATISQAACEFFVRDAKVAVVVVYADISVAGDKSFGDCLDKAGIAQVNAWYSGGDERYLRAHPLIFEPSALNRTRIARLLVDGLAAQGFYKDQKTVGILTYDSGPHRRAVDEVMRPRLKAIGVEADVFYLSEKQSVQDASRTASEANSAVLRFRQSTQRVVVLGAYEPAFFFMNAAASQGYQPKYGLSSENQPADLLEDVPPGQLDTAVGVGYAPYSPDTTAIKAQVASDPKKAAVSPGTLACWEILRKAGFADRNRIQLSTCDAVLFWAEAVKRGLPHLDGLAFKQGAESIGRSFTPAWVSSLAVGPGRQDGTRVWRPLAYQQSCRCLAYTGGEQLIP